MHFGRNFDGQAPADASVLVLKWKSCWTNELHWQINAGTRLDGNHTRPDIFIHALSIRQQCKTLSSSSSSKLSPYDVRSPETFAGHPKCSFVTFYGRHLGSRLSHYDTEKNKFALAESCPNTALFNGDEDSFFLLSDFLYRLPRSTLNYDISIYI